MKLHTYHVLLSLVILSVVELYALREGVDGVSLTGYFACIGLGTGYLFGKREKPKGD